MNVLEFVRSTFREPLAELTRHVDDHLALIRPAQDSKFGDYQANCAMPLRKELGGDPRKIAQRIVDAISSRDAFETIEIAGPGFINLRLAASFLMEQTRRLLVEPGVGIEPPQHSKTMVIDYSSPNVAKPMHVGHLRSTIIGDAIARIHRAQGWTVHSDNHLGDWGTQFGMLIHGWRHLRDEHRASTDPLGELCRLYPLVSQMAENDPQVAEAARAATASLHEGDAETLRLWQTFMPWCLADLRRIYDRLDIHFDHQLGESFYQPMLAETVRELVRLGIAEESAGAICVFFPDPDGKTDANSAPIARFAPAIIQKADGAFTYVTSDLACIQYRVEHFHPREIVYVVDDRQSLHFQQLFEIARRWGYDRVELKHIAFGKITDTDGRPYKTREGGTVGLEALLDEAVSRAKVVVDQNSAELSDEERRRIAEVVGIGAVKYADLSQNRTSDYVFDWEKMISLQGNTATYLQYVYARNRSIFRRGEVDPAQLSRDPPAISLDHPSERALSMALLRFPESLAQSADDFKPNLLCGYLFELANHYNDFFRDCPVLKAGSEPLRRSRLALCEITARTIQRGLGLLGIGTVERM